MPTYDYKDIIQAARLDELALVRLSAWRTEEALPDGHRSADITFNVDHRLLSASQLIGRARIEIQGKIGASEVVKIEMEWQVQYSLDPALDGIGDELLAEFLERNIPINVWPYMREAVATVSVKMALPTIVLPLLPIVR